jgi:hypothetical protein
MRAARGFLGGVLGALAMSAGMGVLRIFGVPIDWEMMLGSLLLGSTGPLVWLIGLGLHLLMGGCFGVAYAAIFEFGLKEANGGIGSAVGAAHAVISGVLLAFVPQLHPLVPEVWPAPGVFLLGLGAFGVLLFIALHVMFGAIVGGYYAASPVLRQIVLRHRQRLFTRS